MYAIQSNGLKGFTIKALKIGTGTLTIDRVGRLGIETNYLKYKITSIGSGEKEKVTALIKKQAKTKTITIDLEKNDYQIIRSLFQNHYYTNALEKIENYNNQYPQGKYKYKINEIKARLHQKQGELKKALDVYQSLLADNKQGLSREYKAKAIFSQADLFYQLQNKEKAMVELLKLTTTFKKSRIYPQALLFSGIILWEEKKYQNALKNYNLFLKRIPSRDYHKTPRADEALFKVAQIYETDKDHLDMKKAYNYYDRLIKLCPLSPLLEKAQSRSGFIYNQFLNIR